MNHKLLTEDDIKAFDTLEVLIKDLQDKNDFLRKRLFTEKRDSDLQLDKHLKRINLLIDILIVVSALVFIIPTLILVNK